MYCFNVFVKKEALQPTVAGFIILSYYIRATTIANKAAPSIRAAEMIIAS
jgi:hypothetical protein